MPESDSEQLVWADVQRTLDTAEAMVWDECHKIYILLDEVTVERFRGHGYDIEEPDYDRLRGWFDTSCGLKFVSSCAALDRFTQIVEQFDERLDENNTDDDDDDLDERLDALLEDEPASKPNPFTAYPGIERGEF